MTNYQWWCDKFLDSLGLFKLFFPRIINQRIAISS